MRRVEGLLDALPELLVLPLAKDGDRKVLEAPGGLVIDREHIVRRLELLDAGDWVRSGSRCEVLDGALRCDAKCPTQGETACGVRAME